MKISRLPVTLAVLALLAPAIHATDFPWPGHGTLTVDLSPDWNVEAKPVGTVAMNFRLTPKSNAPAVFQFAVLATPASHPVNDQLVMSQLQKATEHYIAGSAEGKYVPQQLTVAQGTGWMAEFTDAALVGKPSVPNDFKVMRTTMVALDNHTVAIGTIQFDDPAAPETSAMMAMLASTRFKAGDAGANDVALKPIDGFYNIAVPDSAVQLKIAAKDLVPATDRIGGGTDSPRYFKLQSPASGLVISGWFEPAERFTGLPKLWKTDAKAMVDGGLPPPQNELFLKAGKWEVVAYEQDLSRSRYSDVHVRAEYTHAGTWIDLHLSLTSPLPANEARAKLVRILTDIGIVEKK
ncbi:MAG: hypothetical protein JWM32_1341 [Verrucomicrobia bacterium]|nr:hypothetical protein [Verrucomicrobiota bacterium]